MIWKGIVKTRRKEKISSMWCICTFGPKNVMSSPICRVMICPMVMTLSHLCCGVRGYCVRCQVSYSYLLIVLVFIPVVRYQSPMNLWQVHSIPCHCPPLYLFHSKVHPISITSPTPLHSSLFPLSHPSSLCFLFHWYLFHASTFCS